MNNFINNWDISQTSTTDINMKLKSVGNPQFINIVPKQINIEQRTKNIISDSNTNVIKVKRQILYIKK